MSSTDQNSVSSDRRFFGHPRGLLTLFITEFWERWSFYGMRALLVLFMMTAVAKNAESDGGGLGLSEAHAIAIYHIYGSLIYLMSLPGGWIADRILGPRRSVFWGGVIILLGHVMLAVPGVAPFFTGLGLVIVGTGLLKPNVSTVVGQLYSKDDARRDAAFSIFYMGINLGSFLSQLVCPWLAQSPTFRGWLESMGIDPAHSWQFGFGAAAVGMFCGLVQYARGGRHLGQAGLHPATYGDPAAYAQAKKTLVRWIAAILVIGGVFAALVTSGTMHVTIEDVDHGFGFFLALITIGFFGWLFFSAKWTPAERKRLYVLFVLFVASTLFWSAFEQSGSTLTIFAEEKTSRELGGVTIASGQFQSVNSLAIIFLSPIFAWIWMKLGPRDLSSPVKFALGLIVIGSGYAIMVRGAHIADTGILVSPLWLIMLYMFKSVGEVCLSPVGLSVMSKLAPERIVSLMMGVWFLSISVGFYLGGQIKLVCTSMKLSDAQLFTTIALITIVPGILLALCAKPLVRMMRD
ncbi:MAG: peptide MFS transporter [Planctomycetota bacterium]